ncbi:MAG TPA: anti-virulence regulator CigR family protein [Woeseiaceae bacterium]|nr:anti-virulence regulator CigR family protein [Woeseiaceae bacterium]
MRIVNTLILATLLLGPCAAMAAFEGEGAASVIVEARFSDEEIRIIRDYYRSGDNGDARGRRKGLPPGIAKNLARGKPLPPGIARHYLPDDLRQALPPPRNGYERIVVDGRILLVEIATRVIHDVLVDAVLR